MCVVSALDEGAEPTGAETGEGFEGVETLLVMTLSPPALWCSEENREELVEKGGDCSSVA